MRSMIVLFTCFFSGIIFCQELNCDVKINSDRITVTNQQIFKTLETSLSEFVNNTKWTNQNVKQNERINCSMFINVSAYNSDQFTATIQVQASRPVFNSTYTTPTFNFNDKDFNFRYMEYENLFFNPNSYDSNLVSVVAFYAYIILGMDADSFSPLGGDPYFSMAQTVMNTAQQGNAKGWRQSDGNQTRFMLITDLLSTTFNPIREGNYQYHRNGLDKMADDLKVGKEGVKEALMTVGKAHSVRPNSFLMRVFFDTKSDEILSVFTGGPQVSIADLVDNLNKISPLNSSKWSKIKM